MNKEYRICSVDECQSEQHLRGWCRKHYERWRRHGDPLKFIRASTPEESFEKYAKWHNGCFLWLGPDSGTGYGKISVNGKILSTHRYAWEKVNGPIPEGMQVDHVCHNRGCLNINHLRLATIQQNQFNRSGAQKNSKTGVRNVYKVLDKWRVVITHDGTKHNFGLYSSIKDAQKVAEQKRAELFGSYAGKTGKAA